MNKLYSYSTAICTLPLLATACSETTKQPAKPNIVYILADDMGFGDVSALNDSCRIPTPTLDRMVHQGIAFTDAHSNSAVSTPTRYGTLTGRYAFRTHLKSDVLVGHDPSLIEPGRETVASLLQDNGYHTACVGKWHLGLDWKRKDTTESLVKGNLWDLSDTHNVDYTARVGGGAADHGFDYSYILPASLDIAPYVYVEDGYVSAPMVAHSPAWKSEEARGMWYRHGDISADFSHQTCLQNFTDKSVEYIKSRESKPDEPFFLYFSLTAPHTPWLPSDEFRGRSEAGVYGDFVCMVDDVVNQIYEALEQTGQADNTLVIFTSDNGSHWVASDIKEFGHRANGVLSGGKSDVWEGGHRVPYIVTWPTGLKNKGSESEHLVCATDLMATCADMLGVELSDGAGEDSYSFWAMVVDEPTSQEDKKVRRDMIHHSINGVFGYRTGDWVMIDGAGSGGWSLDDKQALKMGMPSRQLYNLKDDISQQHNLAENHPERVASMQMELRHQVSSGQTRPMLLQ